MKGKTFASLASVGVMCGFLYAHLIEKRSLGSLLAEEILQKIPTKKLLDPKSDYKVKRLLDVVQFISDKPYHPPYLISNIEEKQVDGMQVFEWNASKKEDEELDPKQKVILFIHGGGYALQPNIFHFKMVDDIAKKVGARVVFPIYPKAPRYTFTDSFPKMVSLYLKLVKQVEEASQITIMGDSAGGGFSLALAMFLRDHSFPQPGNIIMLSPWLDLNTQHPDIKYFEEVDPTLSAWGLNKMGLAWAGGVESMKLPYVSPIYGQFNDLGKLTFIVGTHEIFYPDNVSVHNRLVEEGILHHFIIGKKMNHAFPLYPIIEAEAVKRLIAQVIQGKPLKLEE